MDNIKLSDLYNDCSCRAHQPTQVQPMTGGTPGFVHQTVGDCPHCNGAGIVLTESGKSIRTLFEKLQNIYKLRISD